MDSASVSSPVVMIIFNRPDTTARVFAEVARARPSQLLVIADGPRADRPGEAEQCAAARKIIEQVDWPCDVLTNFSNVNLGCRVRVSSGLDWVFNTVEEAIILEDDCVPDPTFFRFCDDLLAKYRTDQRVMMISGDNFQFGVPRGPYSYFFSRFCHVWGWATWRRAWQFYDLSMRLWPTVRDEGWLVSILDDPGAARRWGKTFDLLHSGRVDTWDIQWLFTCWVQGGLSIMPNVNLVSNIGFGPGATHTNSATYFLANLPTSAIHFPLHHPPIVVRHRDADRYTESAIFHRPSEMAKRVLQKMRNKVVGVAAKKQVRLSHG